MKLSLLAVIASLSIAVPGVAVAQEAGTCEPQTIAQLLGLEDIVGCVNEPAEPGEDPVPEDPESDDRVTGLLNAHEASGGRSTAALEHANTMSGGAVLAAHSRHADDDDTQDDDDGDQDDQDAHEDDREDRGRPAHAGRGRP